MSLQQNQEQLNLNFHSFKVNTLVMFDLIPDLWYNLALFPSVGRRA